MAHWLKLYIVLGQYKDELKGKSQTAKGLKDTLDKLLKTKNDVAFLQGTGRIRHYT